MPGVEPVGRAYRNLLNDMLSASTVPSDLRSTLEAGSKLAPEAPGGLNIEGLSAGAAGELLIGFRNPVPEGKAIVVPFENPAAVVENEAARFGAPILLDLGGRGIRSLERMESGYLVVAGPPDDNGAFALYTWSGSAGDPPVESKSVDFGDLHPEALFAVPGTDRVSILSDDGNVQVDGEDCKDQDEAKQSFRGVTLLP